VTEVDIKFKLLKFASPVSGVKLATAVYDKSNSVKFASLASGVMSEIFLLPFNLRLVKFVSLVSGVMSVIPHRAISNSLKLISAAKGATFPPIRASFTDKAVKCGNLARKVTSKSVMLLVVELIGLPAIVMCVKFGSTASGAMLSNPLAERKRKYVKFVSPVSWVKSYDCRLSAYNVNDVKFVSPASGVKPFRCR